MTKNSVTAVASAIGVDLGDRRSQVCVMDVEGEIVEEASIPTTWKAFEEYRAEYSASLDFAAFRTADKHS